MIDIPADLRSYLEVEENRALDTSLNEERAIALDFYNGEPFGDEEEGRSQLVTRDVAEVIDYMVVSIMRTIVSGDRVVEFRAREADQDEMAEDATELVQWQFMRDQPGYQILHDFLKAGLLEKSGVIKTWAEPTTEIVEESNVPAAMLDAEFEADGGASIVDMDPDGEQVEYDPLTGEPYLIETYAVRRKVPGRTKFRDMAVPNEEFRVSPEARTLDDAGYIRHQTRKPLSWFVAAGLVDEEDAGTLWDSAEDQTNLSDARDAGRSRKDTDDASNGLSRQVWLTEEYIRWDINGDGEAERLCIWRVANKVLKVEEVEDQPFVLWTPFPMQHRLIGQSLADKVMDIQRVRSVLLRQAMDALYFANSPRIAVNMQNADPNTLDDILSIVPGAPIRYQGNIPPQPITMPFAAPNAFQALEFMAGERESRTGITRLNQGLDADALNKTATGTALMQAQGQQIEEYLARNFAEALAELFEKKLRLMRDYGSITRVRVGGEYREIDPAGLDGEMDMVISVGLGSGRKDQRLMHRMQVLEMQKEAMAGGLSIVTEDELYNSAKGYVEDAGLGDVNSFFADPNAIDPETGQPKPKQERQDPAVIEAQGKAAAEQAKVQADVMKAQTQAELDRAKAEAQIETDRMRAEMQMQVEREKAALQEQLARDKAAAEIELQRERMRAEIELARENAALNRSFDLSQNRPGGSLAA